MQPAHGPVITPHFTFKSSTAVPSTNRPSAMPPLTATSKPLEPVALAPCVNVHSRRDAWIEKVFGPSERVTPSKPHKNSDDNEEHSYTEELQRYIAEATANLSVGDAEPLSYSDSSDESIYSDVFDSESEEDDYVEPSVEVPRNYCTQDLQGGMLVGGDCVLFTNWAFKRQLHRGRCLPPIREREFELPSSDEGGVKGVYSGKIVEL